MIELRGVTTGGFREASLALAPGESCRLLLASETDLVLFLRLLVGTEGPASGTVLLFGEEIRELPEPAALALLARLGLVWPAGGAVSNLKNWENILLPLWYHGDAGATRRENEVIDLLGRIGMEPERIPVFLRVLPGGLSVRERRMLAVVRAMMQDSEVMIYASLFEGLDQRTRTRLRDEADRHQGRRAGRSSLYVAHSVQGLPEPFDGRSLRLNRDGGIEPWD